MLDYSKVFENKSASVFDNMDRLMKLITEADGDEEGGEEENGGEEEGGEEAPAEESAPDAGGDEEAPAPDASAPTENTPSDEIAEEEDGIYVSANEKAVLAKTMLDALLATPPQPGEIPEEYLNVTNSNADQVISIIQSYMSISANSDLTDTNEDDNMVGELKNIS